MKGLVPLLKLLSSATLKLFGGAYLLQAERRVRDAQNQHRQHLQSITLARVSRNVAAEGTIYESGETYESGTTYKSGAYCACGRWL